MGKPIFDRPKSTQQVDLKPSKLASRISTPDAENMRRARLMQAWVKHEAVVARMVSSYRWHMAEATKS